MTLDINVEQIKDCSKSLLNIKGAPSEFVLENYDKTKGLDLITDVTKLFNNTEPYVCPISNCEVK